MYIQTRIDTYRHLEFCFTEFLYFHTQERGENLTHQYISTVYMCI